MSAHLGGTPHRAIQLVQAEQLQMVRHNVLPPAFPALANQGTCASKEHCTAKLSKRLSAQLASSDTQILTEQAGEREPGHSSVDSNTFGLPTSRGLCPRPRQALVRMLGR